MALIKCPECANEVSTTATSCPKCGFVLNTSAPVQDEPVRVIKEMLAANDKIGAIKYYREHLPGVGLAEAKQAVESIERGESHTLQASHASMADSSVKKGGYMSVLIFAVLIGSSLIALAAKNIWPT